MARYIDIQYLFKCETCRHCIGEYKCNAYCDSGECYSPNMTKIPTAEDVAPKSEVAREIFEEIEKYMMDFVDVTHTAYKEIGTATFAELKKKYTEGEK